MAATFEWGQDSGTQTGSPLKGTTRYTAVTDCNWKATDDVATAYSASPIVAGQNSYTKFQFAKFGGSWNTITNGKWSLHTADSASLGTGITLKGKAGVAYATPSTTTNTNLTTDYTSIVSIGSGETVNFSATGPEDASPTSSVTGGGTCYSVYLASQMQTTNLASPGNTATVTATISYDES